MCVELLLTRVNLKKLLQARIYTCEFEYHKSPVRQLGMFIQIQRNAQYLYAIQSSVCGIGVNIYIHNVNL